MTQTEEINRVSGEVPRAPEPPVAGPPPAYDPECAAGMAAWLELMPKLVSLDGIPALREFMESVAPTPDEDLVRGGTYSFVERQVPGPLGDPDITLLICTPVGLQAPTAAIYNVHGGGMVGGNRRLGIQPVLDLAAAHGMVVVSVEYRVAPEHPDPAPIEDCYAGLVWTAEHAREIGIDPDRIVIVGASAGGGLAAGTVLLARDRGGPALLGQMLVTPMLDDRNDTASALQMAGSGIWDRAANGTGWLALLGERQGGPDVSAYAAPARVSDLSGLPPTLLDVGSAETFRDEVVTYASRIWQAGGHAELHVWPGGFHGYDGVAPQAPVSRATVQARHDWLRRLLAI